MRPTTAETFALRRVITLCIELGLSHMILEGDAQIIFKGASSYEDDYGVLIDEARRMLIERKSCRLNLTYREANFVAYKLAKLAVTMSEKKSMD